MILIHSDKINDSYNDDLRRFLIASGKIPLLAGLRGPLFERFSHFSLAAGGTFQVRDLSSSSKEPKSIKHLTLPCSEVLRFQSLDDVSSAKSEQYCQPSASNFPSVDALMKVCLFCC